MSQGISVTHAHPLGVEVTITMSPERSAKLGIDKQEVADLLTKIVGELAVVILGAVHYRKITLEVLAALLAKVTYPRSPAGERDRRKGY